MLHLWANLTAEDFQTYVPTIEMPGYMRNLCLEPPSIAAQEPNLDGKAKLRFSFVGESRIEDYVLAPEDHAIPLLQHVFPRINTDRIALPRDGASWHWQSERSLSGSSSKHNSLCSQVEERERQQGTSSTKIDEAVNFLAEEPKADGIVKLYFSPVSKTIGDVATPLAEHNGYVSVSRGHLFIPKAVVVSYVEMRLARLGLAIEGIALDLQSSSGIAIEAERIGGDLILADTELMRDLIHYCALEAPLAAVADQAEIQMDDVTVESCGIFVALVTNF